MRKTISRNRKSKSKRRKTRTRRMKLGGALQTSEKPNITIETKKPIEMRHEKTTIKDGLIDRVWVSKLDGKGMFYIEPRDYNIQTDYSVDDRRIKIETNGPIEMVTEPTTIEELKKLTPEEKIKVKVHKPEGSQYYFIDSSEYIINII